MPVINDGQSGFLGGQDASQHPDAISENCFAAGVNVSTRRGVITPRHGLIKHSRKLQFPDGGVEFRPYQFRDYAAVYHGGKFQAQIPYQIGRQFYQLVIISGTVFLINQDTWAVEVLKLPDGSRLDELASRINWSQAGRFLVLHDFPARPVIIEGRIIRRSVAADFEVPVSVMSVYNQNRLFIANAGSEFTAGDPAGSLAALDAPITFQEIAPGQAYPAQIFQVPSDLNNSPITAMAFLQAVDSSTGIGTLIVSTSNSMYAYKSYLPRSQWEASQFGSNIVYNVGVAGPRCILNVNSDLFFLSPDGGFRTLSMARSQQGTWSRLPLSEEVGNWLKYDDKSLVKFGVLGYFDNKIFVTSNPYRVPATRLDGRPTTDIAYGGLSVLELHNLSRLGTEAIAPCWAGLWTGTRPMDMCTNDGRFFVMSKDDGGRNELYELDPKTTHDTDGKYRRRIQSRVYTREYAFQNPFQNKEVKSIDVQLENLEGCFELKVDYRPHHSAQFLPWAEFNHYAPTCTPTVPVGTAVNGLASHTLRELNLGSPPSEFTDPVTGDLFSVFRKLQLRIDLKGDYWALNAFKLAATIRAQNESMAVTEQYPCVELLKECNTDWVIGPFET